MIARLACNLLLLNTDWSESRSRLSSIFSTTMKAATQLLKGRGFAYKRFAISRKVRVPIIESVIRPSVATSSGKFVDLNMLVMIGGRERTEAGYCALPNSADLKLARIIPTATEASVIEGVPSRSVCLASWWPLFFARSHSAPCSTRCRRGDQYASDGQPSVVIGWLPA